MKNTFFFFFFFFLFYGCSDDEMGTPLNELSCLGDASTPIVQSDCDNFPLNPQICESVYVGDYTLEEESRKFLPQFCRGIGDRDIYVNANGEKVEMEVVLKNFINTHSLRNTFMPCENDSTKNIGACIGLEAALMKMRSLDSTIELNLQLHTKLSSGDPLSGKVADYVEISRAAGNNTFVLDFSVIVNERDVGNDPSPFQENLGAIDLLGESFDDVISSDISFFNDPKPFKYYYNWEVGLIAFQDSDGVLWRIQD